MTETTTTTRKFSDDQIRDRIRELVMTGSTWRTIVDRMESVGLDRKWSARMVSDVLNDMTAGYERRLSSDERSELWRDHHPLSGED